jgi:four helix bundle protein
MEGKYLPLKDLQVYQLARKLSVAGWKIYNSLDWKIRKIIGDQFIEATDSVGANIAEGYLHYHFLDKIRFYYNARASHAEAVYHWLELLRERGFVNMEIYQETIGISAELAPKLNKFIGLTYKMKDWNNKKPE